MHYRINNNLTYLHVPKTGGTSMGKWIENNFKDYRKMYRTDTNEVHSEFFYMIEEYKDNCMAVVRNPYDRLVSFYYHVGNSILDNITQKRHETSKYKDENIFLKQFNEWNKGFKHFVFNCKYIVWKTRCLDEVDPFGDHRQWIANPQVKFTGTDLSKFTILLRFENLENDFQQVQLFLSCNQPLPKENMNIHKTLQKTKWEDYYDNETRNEVYRFWQDDFELFEYKK